MEYWGDISQLASGYPPHPSDSNFETIFKRVVFSIRANNMVLLKGSQRPWRLIDYGLNARYSSLCIPKFVVEVVSQVWLSRTIHVDSKLLG
jgi:hypothetical protein